MLEQVGRDEIGHVAFAFQWIERLSGEAPAYETWAEYLPSPLTPGLMRGRPLNVEARSAAGFTREFLTGLEGSAPTTEGTTR